MMRMFFLPYAKFLMLKGERSVIWGGADHTVSRTVEDGVGGGTMVIVSVTVCGGAVIVTAGADW